jgi:hypothetical protein
VLVVDKVARGSRVVAKLVVVVAFGGRARRYKILIWRRGRAQFGNILSSNDCSCSRRRLVGRAPARACSGRDCCRSRVWRLVCGWGGVSADLAEETEETGEKEDNSSSNNNGSSTLKSCVMKFVGAVVLFSRW